jgi:hypothetical protein
LGIDISNDGLADVGVTLQNFDLAGNQFLGVAYNVTATQWEVSVLPHYGTII